MNANTNVHPDFLSTAVKQHFIGGRWCPSLSGETVDTFNPATGKVIAQLARGRQEDINAAVVAARRAFNGPWSKFAPADRQRLLTDL